MTGCMYDNGAIAMTEHPLATIPPIMKRLPIFSISLLLLTLATGCATSPPAAAQHSAPKAQKKSTSTVTYGQRKDALQWA